jgi:radical SAM superfamily enzyme YgiQ (UPF0313 family)
MPDIVLTTLNARYAHSAFGLRYLLANLGDLRDRGKIIEFDIQQRPTDVVERILAERPRLVGLSVYIWNVEPLTRVVSTLKRLRPEIAVVLGGPEVSHGPADRPIVRDADHVIRGESDLAFASLCRRVLDGDPPESKFVQAELPALDRLVLPYELYDDEDVAHRVIYVEASRGCPFHCEFCLSALDVAVRQFPVDSLLAALQVLLDRGVRTFKFVDRTFNLNARVGLAILEFFADRYRPGLFLHFEMIPDRLPASLHGVIRRFPHGALQFEVGIQTFDETVSARISRRQDNAKVEHNLRFLRAETGVHIHADLIVGLPGEDLDGFASGFDRLVDLAPQEIQVGILKRLHGAPIARHDRDWEMVYAPDPPYEILRTRSIDFETMQRLRRFARYWDLVANSGNFVETVPMIWEGGSPFRGFLEFSDWLYDREGRTHAIALQRLFEIVREYLITQKDSVADRVDAAMTRDYQRGGRGDLPRFLRGPVATDTKRNESPASVPRRQARHWSRTEGKS